MLKLKKNCCSNEYASHGVVAGLTVTGYLLLVGLFFVTAEAFFPAQSGWLILGIVAFLLLFVASAAFCAAIVFGRFGSQ